jgi:tetratricopeptide (TPR) repeat protein/WD40 repeat protein
VHRAPAGGVAPAKSILIEDVSPFNLWLTPDGQTLIGRVKGKRAYTVWDTATGKVRATLPAQGVPELSPDGRVFVTVQVEYGAQMALGAVNTVTFWDVATGKALGTWQDPDQRRARVAAAAARAALGTSPFLAAAPLPDGQPQGTHLSISFSPDGRTLLASSDTKTWLLDTANGREIAVWDADARAGVGRRQLFFSPNGQAVAIERQHKDPATGGLTNLHSVSLVAFPGGRLLAQSPPVRCSSWPASAFTADGKALVFCNVRDLDTDERCVVQVLETATGRQYTLERPPGAVTLSPDGRRLLSQRVPSNPFRGKSGPQAWWDQASGRELGRLSGITGPAAWGPDGESLFVPTANGVRRLRAADGTELARFAGASAPLAVTADGKTLLAAVPEGVRVWDLASGHERGTVRHQAAVTAVGVHPEGPRLVSLVWNGPPKFWDLRSGREVEAGRLADALLDGRTHWARELSFPGDWAYPDYEAQPGAKLAQASAAGAGTVLVNDRFRVVAEVQSLKLWPGGRTTSAAEAEMARGADLTSQGRPDAALAAFRKAAGLAPADARPRLLLADALGRQGKPAEAAAALDEACRLDPSCAWMFADLAEGHPDRAVEWLGKAVAYRPQDPALRYQLAEALARSGGLDTAVKHYEEVIKLYPQHAEAWARQADALAALGRTEQARQARRRAAAISPAYGNPTQVQPAQLLMDRDRAGKGSWGTSPGGGGGDESHIGVRLLNEYYPDEAIDCLRRACLMATSDDPAGQSRHLSRALTLRGQYTEALRFQRLFNRHIPAGATEWRELGESLTKSIERSPELEALRRAALKAEAAFRRDPTDARTGRALVEAYARLNDSPKPAREWLAPNAKLPDNPWLRCELGGALLLEQENDLYARLCRQTADDGKRASDWFGRSKIIQLWGLAEKPAVEAARMVALARERETYLEVAAVRLHALGLACYRAGRYEEAVRHLSECVTGHAEWSAQVLNYQVLALAYHRLGKDGEARRWCARATEWIDRTGEAVAQAAPHIWPLQLGDLQAMWLLERELARALPAAGP